MDADAALREASGPPPTAAQVSTCRVAYAEAAQSLLQGDEKSRALRSRCIERAEELLVDQKKLELQERSAGVPAEFAIDSECAACDRAAEGGSAPWRRCRHHCRECGASVCDDYSRARTALGRMCDECFIKRGQLVQSRVD